MSNKNSNKKLLLGGLAVGAALLFSSFRKTDSENTTVENEPENEGYENEPENEGYENETEIDVNETPVTGYTVTEFKDTTDYKYGILGSTITTSKVFLIPTTYYTYFFVADFAIPQGVLDAGGSLQVKIFDDKKNCVFTTNLKKSGENVVFNVTTASWYYAEITLGTTNFYAVYTKVNEEIAAGNGKPELYSFKFYQQTYNALFQQIKANAELKRQIAEEKALAEELEANKVKTEEELEYEKTHNDFYFGDPDAEYDAFYDYNSEADLMNYGYLGGGISDNGTRNALRARIIPASFSVGEIRDWQPFDAWHSLPGFMNWIKYYSDNGYIIPGTYGARFQTNGMEWMPFIRNHSIYRFYFLMEVFNPYNFDVTITNIFLKSLNYCGGGNMVPYSDEAALELSQFFGIHYVDEDHSMFHQNTYWYVATMDQSFLNNWDCAQKDTHGKSNSLTGFCTNYPNEGSQNAAGDNFKKMFFAKNTDRGFLQTQGAYWQSQDDLATKMQNSNYDTFKARAQRYTLDPDGGGLYPMKLGMYLHFSDKKAYNGEITIPEGGSVFIPVSLGDSWVYGHSDWNGCLNGGFGHFGISDSGQDRADYYTNPSLSVQLLFHVAGAKVDSFQVDQKMELRPNTTGSIQKEGAYSGEVIDYRDLQPSFSHCGGYTRGYDELKAMHDLGYAKMYRAADEHGVEVFGRNWTEIG